MTRRVLLIGATGVFGCRLAAMLAAHPDIELLLAARGIGALERLAGRLEAGGARATLAVRSVDRRQPGAIAHIRPWLTIDASGPFQDGDYALALSAVEAGSHYLDLADARAFVAGFPQALGGAAAANRVLAVSGASSTPALSHAVLDAMTLRWQEVAKIAVVIAPGARAPVGLAVLRSILGYAGQPVRLLRGGRWCAAPGWSGLRRVDMPGLGFRWASLCETPDLDLLPARFRVRQDALFFAGLELSLMHLGLAALCLLVRWRLVRSLRPLAAPLRTAARLIAPLGRDRGGMVVEAEGRDERGRPIRARWALWAEAGAGPNTPAAPAAAIVRRLLAGSETRQGAFACAGLLPLEAILGELTGLPIRTRTDESHPVDPSLFRRLLGRRFEQLPPSVRALHEGRQDAVFAGSAIVRTGRGVAARCLRRALRLPPAGRCNVEVRIAPAGPCEIWTRRFGSSGFASRLAPTGRLGVFEERFGPLRFAFRLDAARVGLAWEPITWRCLGLPLPACLAPQVRARECEKNGRYHFAVVVAHAWSGLLFAYRGWLA